MTMLFFYYDGSFAHKPDGLLVSMICHTMSSITFTDITSYLRYSVFKPRPIKKNSVCRFVRRCSYCVETEMPLGTVVILSMPVSVPVSLNGLLP